MKVKVNNYAFDATAKTVTFTDYEAIRLDSVLLITNVTKNVIIYNFASPKKGGTVAGNVLTLFYDTSKMSSGDKLQVYYEDERSGLGATEDNQLILNELVETLQELASRLNVLGSMAQSGIPALRVHEIGTNSVVGTISVDKFGGAPGLNMSNSLNNSAAIQSNINNVTV